MTLKRMNDGTGGIEKGEDTWLVQRDCEDESGPAKQIPVSFPSFSEDGNVEDNRVPCVQQCDNESIWEPVSGPWTGFGDEECLICWQQNCCPCDLPQTCQRPPKVGPKWDVGQSQCIDRCVPSKVVTYCPSR